MKKFLYKLLIFSILVSGTVVFILMQFGGYVDYFYEKLAAPRQSSLILGDSRSFQGIQPSIFEEQLDSQFDLPILNFSFTIAQTAYGDDFFRTVRGKVDEETKNGLFVISVHPWLFAQRETDNYKEGKFFESDVPPNNMRFVSMSPNIEYFFKNYSYFHFKALVKRNSIVHKDGWLEEFYMSKDTVTVNKWKKTQIELYDGFSKKWQKNDFRLNKFTEMVKYLKKYGTVVLVRMPVDAEIVEIENSFWQGFDTDMEKVASQNGLQYLNYTQTDYGYHKYDGLHLDHKSSTRFTRSLCDSIKQKMN